MSDEWKSDSEIQLGGQLDEHYDTYQSLLNKVDSIRKLTQDVKGITIPFIVVCGEQSMGKSSLLELISGVNLPRGMGIKTRVPLELQLRRAKNKKEELIRIKADFGSDIEANCNISSDQVIDISQVSDKIEEFTNILAGKDVLVVNKPITLTIYGMDLVDLTLIDLPGIVHNEEKGITQAIRQMLEQYISHEEAIILNVISFMSDPTIYQSITISKKYDPQRKRTFIVATHIDRVERDQTVSARYNMCMSNSLLFKPQSVFLIRNRTSEENEQKTPLRQVQQNETKFFKEKYEKDAYTGISLTCLGSKALTKALVDIQKQRILCVLPGIKNKIITQIEKLRIQIENIPEIIETPKKASAELFKIIGMLFDYLVQVRDGMFVADLHNNAIAYNCKQQFICSHTLSLFEKFRDDLRLIKKPNDFISRDFLLTLRKLDHNSRGFNALPGTMHPSIALQVIGELVAQVEKPASILIDNVCEYLQSRIDSFLKENASNWRNLTRYLTLATTEMLENYRKICKQDVANMLRRERKPFSINPNYASSISSAEQMLFNARKNNSIDSCSACGLWPLCNASNEILLTSNKLHKNVSGLYKRSNSSNGNIIYQKFAMNIAKLFTIELISNKWVIKQSPYGQLVRNNTNNELDEVKTSNDDKKSEVVDVDAEESKSSLLLPSENDDIEKVLATQTSNANSCHPNTPALVTQWDVSDLKIDVYDLQPFLHNKDYLKMDDIERKLFDEAVKMEKYWKVVCDRLCDVIPMCVRDYLVDCPCNSRHKVQSEMMQIKNITIKTHDDWLMHLMSLDEEKDNERKQCVMKLKYLTAAKTEAQDIEYLAQQMQRTDPNNFKNKPIVNYNNFGSVDL